MPDATQLKNDDFSRENLIAICEAAVVPVAKWRNRDTPGAQEAVGLCWAMLKAGCDFHVHPASEDSGCYTDDHTIWLTVHWPTFSSFEYENGETQDATFYLPTPKRLLANTGRDWY